MYKTNINHSDRKQANVVLSSATIGSLESSLQALCKHLHLLHEKACFVDCAKQRQQLSCRWLLQKTCFATYPSDVGIHWDLLQLHTTSITFAFKPKHFSYKRSFCFLQFYSYKVLLCTSKDKTACANVPTITWGDNRWFLCAGTHVLGAKHHAISRQKTQPNCFLHVLCPTYLQPKSTQRRQHKEGYKCETKNK